MGGRDRAAQLKGTGFVRLIQIGGSAKRPDYGKKLEALISDGGERYLGGNNMCEVLTRLLHPSNLRG